MRASTDQSPMTVEIQLNTNTLATRHVFTLGPLQLHLSQADIDAGWTSVVAYQGGDAFPPGEIEKMEADAAAQHRAYWEQLATGQGDRRVVVGGHHFVAHDFGVGTGFGGEVFRVQWHDGGRVPLTCHLSAQGKVPGWLRPQLPDNATATSLRYRVAPQAEGEHEPNDMSQASVFGDVDQDALG